MCTVKVEDYVKFYVDHLIVLMWPTQSDVEVTDHSCDEPNFMK